MRRPFMFFLFFQHCVFLPTVLFLQCFPDFVHYFLFLCVLLVIVSSVFSSFVFVFLCFRMFTVCLSCVFLTSLGAFRVLFGIRFIFLFVFASLQFWLSLLLLLLFHRIFWGFDSVLGVANSPAVPAVALPFFVLLFPLRVFRMLRFRLLHAVFLGVFPHAVAMAGFSGLPPRFPLAAATVVPSCLPQLFHLLQLWLLLSLLARLLLSSVLGILRLRFLGVRVLLSPAFILVFYGRVFAE